MKEQGYTDIEVTLQGISGILFDRFLGHTDGKEPPEQKLYLINENQLVLPAENVLSFLCGIFPAGCVKAFEGRKATEYIRTLMPRIHFAPDAIPFLDGKMKPIKFDGFDNGSPLRIVTASARTKSGSASIKQPAKDRPLLDMPWHLKFKISLWDNVLVSETKLRNYFERGGIEIALGTWRPRYGRFVIKSWEIK